MSLDAAGGLLRHNRFDAGDPGFASDADFDSAMSGNQTLPPAGGTQIALFMGAGNDYVVVGSGRAAAATLGAVAVDGQAGTDSILVHDGADPVARAVLVTPTDVLFEGIEAAVGHTSVESLSVSAGLGPDTVTVRASAATAVVLERLLARLGRHLDVADERLAEAASLCAEPERRGTRKALGAAAKRLGKTRMVLRSPAAGEVPVHVRNALADAADAVGADLRALRAAVSCPPGVVTRVETGAVSLPRPSGTWASPRSRTAAAAPGRTAAARS